ncbi:MAG: response regulator [Anaerolineae bacterium]|nr:response regulator [Anaerolineae bacterium]MBN8619548.1 response regulator [Anaerolineae bacterium]
MQFVIFEKYVIWINSKLVGRIWVGYTVSILLLWLTKEVILVGTVDIDFTKYSALAVEDDAGGMAIIGVMMRYMGLQSYMNATGEGVVELALAMKPRPNIIFLDLNLPKTNGYEIIKKIRAESRLKDVLVIAVTAQDADEEIPRCMEAGFDGFIGKPISRTRFPRQLRRILMGDPVWETY